MRTLTDLAAILALVLLLGFFQERDEADHQLAAEHGRPHRTEVTP